MKSFFLSIYRSKPFFKYRKAWFLLGVCFIFVILRLPSLTEPHWYGDEGIYQVVGRAIDSGKILYRDIWDNKPPLLYVIYALVHGNLFAVKLLSLISGLLSVGAFYFLSGKLLKSTTSRNISTLVYAVLFGLPLLEGNIANAENFMLFPIIFAAYSVFCFTENKKRKYIIFAGLLLSIAFVTKIVALFDFCSFFLFLYCVHPLKSKKNFGMMATFTIAFSSLFLISSVYFLALGSFKDFISAVFLQNVSYVGDQNKFIFPMGILIIKSVLLVGLIGWIVAFRKKLSKSTLFLYLWIVFCLYNAFFSEKPYIHYLLVLLPAFSLVVGHFFEYIKTRLVDCVLLLVVILVAYFHFQIYKKTISYYTNYIQFVTNHKSIVDYESFFDMNTPRDYDIANFIKTNTSGNDTVFLWSDNAQIYALSQKLPIGKYIVAYHITFYKNADIITKQQIEQSQPRYIIQTTEEPLVQDILSSYKLRYIMEGTKIYEREI